MGVRNIHFVLVFGPALRADEIVAVDDFDFVEEFRFIGVVIKSVDDNTTLSQHKVWVFVDVS